MDIKNSFEVPLPVDEAWKTLLDVRKIVPCMPGAELLETIDSETYKGKVSVRLGPVSLSFVGTAHFEEIDDTAHRACVKAQGTDSKGRGGASAVVSFTLSPVDNGSKVDVHTNVNLSGAVAQYGRGAGIIQDVATQIIGQFALALRERLQSDVADALATEAGGIGVRGVQRPLPVAKPISGFSLVAAVVWKFIGRIFRRTSAAS